MNILNSADTAATINLITRNARGTTTTSDGATAAGKIIKENLPDIISAGFDMPHPTSIFEGVPPFSFISNGEPLVNWLIYGNTVEGASVGDKTSNLYDKFATSTDNGYLEHRYLKSDGDFAGNDQTTSFITEYIDISGFTNIALSQMNRSSAVASLCFYDSAKTYLSGVAYQALDVVTTAVPSNAKYLRFTCYYMMINTAMLNTGDTALPYEPYGYKIPVICGGVTTNIYIDEPLTAGETISYADTSTVIPTSMFLNTLSVGTTVQPEKVFIEYVK